MSDDSSPPDYFQNSLPLSDDDYWDRIEQQFDDLSAILPSLTFETRTQSVGEKVGKKIVDKGVYWQDPEFGARVRSWLQIPYNPVRDEEDFIEKLGVAKTLVERIRPIILSKSLTVEFVSVWGVFCEYAGQINGAYIEDRPNLSNLKGAAMNSVEPQMIWYSKLYCKFEKASCKRADIDRRVLDHLMKIIKTKKFPDERFDQLWYEKMLGETAGEFSSSFKQNKLPKKQIDKLAKSNTIDIPPIDS